MATTSDVLTAELLLQSRAGNKSAFDHLYTRLYTELREAARGQRRRYRGSTLDTGTLVHEAYIRLVDERNVAWECRAHFLAIAARAMRRALVDHIRREMALKRGGARAHITLRPDLLAAADQPDLIVAIDNTLSSLAAFNPRMARIAECRLFGGLTEEETAGALGVSVRTVQREWRRVRAWLQQELSD